MVNIIVIFKALIMGLVKAAGQRIQLEVDLLEQYFHLVFIVIHINR